MSFTALSSSISNSSSRRHNRSGIRPFQVGGMELRRQMRVKKQVWSMKAERRQARKPRHCGAIRSQADRNSARLALYNDALCFILRTQQIAGCITNTQDLNILHSIVLSRDLTEKTAALIVESGVVAKLCHFMSHPCTLATCTLNVFNPVVTLQTSQTCTATAEAAQKVAEMMKILFGYSRSFLKTLEEDGAIEMIFKCLDRFQVESVFCACVEALKHICISSQAGQKAMKRGVISYMLRRCHYSTASTLDKVLDTLRNFVKIAEAADDAMDSQHAENKWKWQALLPIAPFAARVLHHCRLSKLKHEVPNDAVDAMELDQTQGIDFNKPWDGESHQLELDAMWLLYELMDTGYDELVLSFAGIGMPMKEELNVKNNNNNDNDNDMNGMQQEQQEQKEQPLFHYLHEMFKNEFEKCKLGLDWDERVCYPILALWSVIAAKKRYDARRLVLSPNTFGLIRWFLITSSWQRNILLKMLSNVIFKGGAGSEQFYRWDDELVGNLVNWAQIGKSHPSEVRMEACRLLTVCIKCVVPDVRSFILSPRMIKMFEMYLDSRREFDVYWAVATLVEGLEKIEKNDKNALKSVINALEMNRIVGGVSSVTARVADDNYSDVVVNAIDELLEKYFDMA